MTPDKELLNVKYAFNFETLIYIGTSFTNNVNFQAIEVVYRGSEIQIQVTENLN